MDLVVVRLLFVLIIAVTCYLTDPFDLPAKLDAGVGALIGLGIILFEWRLRRVSLKRLIGAAVGNPLAGAAIGGGIGALGGYAVGNEMQNRENENAQTQAQISSQQRQLESQQRQIQQMKSSGETE